MFCFGSRSLPEIRTLLLWVLGVLFGVVCFRFDAWFVLLSLID